jgi:hypothetical protein
LSIHGDISQNTWILRNLADSSNGSEKVEKAVWLAEHSGTFPTEVFLSTISKVDTAGEPPSRQFKQPDEVIERKASVWFEHETSH